MKLSVQLFAVLRERAGSDRLVLEDLPDELDMGGLKRELALRHPELGELGHVAGVLGTDYVADDTALSDGDEVALLPPVSGGSSADPRAAADTDGALAQGIFELVEHGLDPAACERRVADAGCGAIVSFTGTTREHNRGQAVERLEYEAFEAMTGPEMERIFAACRAELGVRLEEHDQHHPQRLRMLCQHRVGQVEVGQPSVVICVASPHRDAAFGACRFLIDRLKQTLPIWKKEIYADGQHWIGDRS